MSLEREVAERLINTIESVLLPLQERRISAQRASLRLANAAADARQQLGIIKSTLRAERPWEHPDAS